MSVPSWAFPGAKCVCIVDLAGIVPIVAGNYRGPYPAKNEVITIAAVHSSPVPHADFEEYPPFIGGGLGVRFRYLRPLVIKSLEQDISIFTPLLQTKRQGVDA